MPKAITDTAPFGPCQQFDLVAFLDEAFGRSAVVDHEAGDVALVVDRGRRRAGEALDVDFVEAPRANVIGEAMGVAVAIGPEADRLVVVVHAKQLFDRHAAGRAFAMRVHNVGEDAVVLDKAEVVVDHVGVVAVGPEADRQILVVDAGDLGLD